MSEEVISGISDIAFVVNPTNHPDLIIKELTKDRITIWKSKNCKNPDVLIIEPGLLQTQNLLHKLEKKDFKFSRIVESSSLEVISQLVNCGAGCALLPEQVIKAIADSNVQHVKDSPEFIDRISLIYKHEFRKLKCGQALIEILSKKF